jgi:tetratricopeptide (TPR) repeat protein
MKYLGIYLVVVSLSFLEVQAQQKPDSLLISLQNNYTLGTLTQIAYYYRDNYNYTKSIEYFEQILSAAQKEKNQQLIVTTLQNIAEAYQNVSDYQKVLMYSRWSIENLQLPEDKKLTARIFGNMAAAFLNLSIYDSVDVYINKALQINSSISNKEGMADNYCLLANLNLKKNGGANSINYLEKALSIIVDAKNPKIRIKILIALASYYSNSGDHARALESCLDAITIAEKCNYKMELGSAQQIISNIYRLKGDLDKALSYLQKAQIIFEEVNEKGDRLSSLLSSIAIIYTLKGDYNKALTYQLKILDMRQKTGNKGALANTYTDIGVSYHFMEKYIPAMEYYQKALVYCKELPDSNTLCVVQNNIAEVYRDAPDSILILLGSTPANRYNIAINKFMEDLALAKSINHLEYQKVIWDNLTITYQKNNDFINAFYAYKNYIKIKDQIFNDKTKQKINRLEIQYEFNKKEDSLNMQKKITETQLLQQEILNKQQSQNLILQNNRLQLSQQQLKLFNKEKDLQHLAFLKTQAELQNEQLQKSEQEKQLAISQKEKQLKSEQVNALSQENNLNKLQHIQQLLYVAGGFILLLFGGLLFFNRIRHKQSRLKADLEKEKAQQQQKDAEFQRSLAEVSMSALRSQMNPHFIFNCLNSIKLYTTQNDTVSAVAYLTKFSKLIRMALENSRCETVTLHAELESLDLYIQMESMRFKDKLQYNIVVDENVDSNFIEIPPMLLQPYVENAIWHGLMHKEEGGKIDVSVVVMPNEPVLIISIQDNGVGRKKSAALISHVVGRHTSYGTKVTSERLELINKVYKTGASVTTDDVLNESGEIAGTLVTIKIPFE